MKYFDYDFDVQRKWSVFEIQKTKFLKIFLRKLIGPSQEFKKQNLITPEQGSTNSNKHHRYLQICKCG